MDQPTIREYPDDLTDDDGNVLGDADTCSVFVTYEPFPHVEVRTVLHDVPFGSRPLAGDLCWWVEYRIAQPNASCRVNRIAVSLKSAQGLAQIADVYLNHADQYLPSAVSLLSSDLQETMDALSMCAQLALNAAGME